ncbi:hypothetical protein [Nannocystis pusilla]|uniref:hypothetical protein n=1 Tax=Nannocystis pusilla TaxID=889268 RepID=UPI003B7FC537
MTGSDPSATSPKPEIDRAAARGVLDPAWEDELRRGQEAEGEAGSIEDELAIVRLLRHARAPEALTAGELDKLWSGELAPALTPTPWWRRRWLWAPCPRSPPPRSCWWSSAGPSRRHRSPPPSPPPLPPPRAPGPPPRSCSRSSSPSSSTTRAATSTTASTTIAASFDMTLAMSLGDKP